MPIIANIPSPERSTVLIVNDHALIRLGLRALLEPDYLIIGEVQDGRDASPAIERLRPAVVLLGLSLPGKSGMDILRDLTPKTSGPAIVVLSAELDASVAEQVVRLGARAFIPHNASLLELRYGIETARAGGRFLSPSLERSPPPEPTRYPRGYQRLTSREQQVVQMIGVGLTNGRMAHQLRVSYRTVHFHRTNIRRKLGFRTEWEMTRFALEVQQSAVSGKP